MNGNIVNISLESGRIIQKESMSRYYQKCALNYKFKATESLKYETFLARHQNSRMANHKGSPGAMKFFGDGDSKIFPAVEDIYEGIKFEKLECVDHVQKIVGNRLRSYKNNVKGLG